MCRNYESHYSSHTWAGKSEQEASELFCLQATENCSWNSIRVEKLPHRAWIRSCSSISIPEKVIQICKVLRNSTMERSKTTVNWSRIIWVLYDYKWAASFRFQCYFLFERVIICFRFQCIAKFNGFHVCCSVSRIISNLLFFILCCSFDCWLIVKYDLDILLCHKAFWQILITGLLYDESTSLYHQLSVGTSSQFHFLNHLLLC